MNRLDEFDFKIIRILEKDTETPYRSVSDQLGVSLTTVYNRVARLRRMGVIKKLKAEIDYSKLGYSIRALVGISVSPKAQHTALQEFRKLTQVHLIYQVTGRYDYLLEVLVKHTDDLRKLLTEEMGKIDGVQRTETMIVVHIE